MKSETRSETVEEIVLLVFLCACFALSFFKDVFPILEKGLTAAIFASIFFVLKQLRDLRINLKSEDFKEKYFASADDFYSSAARAVGRAKREVCATYFRDAPPTTTGGKRDEYFSAVLNFARGQGDVRRLIKVTNHQLAEWCLEQQQLSKSIDRYYVRVFPFSGGVEPMNMAIMDAETVYLAFAGPTDSQIGGVRPPGPKLADFFKSRFEDHWRIAVPIDEFVDSDAFRTARCQGMV